MKLVTFVRLATPLASGAPVYVMCDKRQECVAGKYEILREGAFVSEEGHEDISALPCVLANTSDTIVVRTKIGEKLIRIPNGCAYTTVGTKALRELGVYRWWRSKAIPSPEERYATTWQIIDWIGGQRQSLVVPLPNDQKIAFGLQKATLRVQMRFSL
jgi:hypothetical protein